VSPEVRSGLGLTNGWATTLAQLEARRVFIVFGSGLGLNF
jgi:hypothetical protein